MKRLLIILAVFASGMVSSPLAWADSDYIFEHVNVVPMNREGVLRDRAVVVSDGRITSIISNANARRIRTPTRVDAAGLYMLPGLADMHIHLRADPQMSFYLYLANGITTVRNMNDADGGFDHVRIRAEIAAGRMEGPRYLISGPFFDPNSLHSVADVEPMLNQQVTRGFDYVKIHDNLPQDIYDAVIVGARTRGLTVTGHAQRDKPLAETLRMYSIEHAEEFLYVAGRRTLADPYLHAAIVREVVDSHVTLCPTLVIYAAIETYLDDTQFDAFRHDPSLAYLPPAMRAEATGERTNEYRARTWPAGFARQVASDMILLEALVRDFDNAGVPLILGTDAFGGVVPGFSLHQELRLLVRAGLSPYRALRTGTVNVAAYLHESGTSGTIEPGKRADFILVDGNPLLDVANAGHVRGVFTHDRWRNAAELAAMLSEVRQHYATAP